VTFLIGTAAPGPSAGKAMPGTRVNMRTQHVSAQVKLTLRRSALDASGEVGVPVENQPPAALAGRRRHAQPPL
jgi:hypothetical protein